MCAEACDVSRPKKVGLRIRRDPEIPKLPQLRLRPSLANRARPALRSKQVLTWLRVLTVRPSNIPTERCQFFQAWLAASNHIRNLGKYV